MYYFLTNTYDDNGNQLSGISDPNFEGIPYLFFSSMAQQGLMQLKDKLWTMLNQTSVH